MSSDSTLKYIDDMYKDCDLLIQKDDALPVPPACRISRMLLQLFLENEDEYATIQSVALKNNLDICYPIELSTIKYGARWTLNDIKRKVNHLYYPVGNYDEHEIYRHYDTEKLYLLY